MTALEQAIGTIERKGNVHEWIWRLIVDHGYSRKAIRSELETAWKYWEKHVKVKKKATRK